MRCPCVTFYLILAISRLYAFNNDDTPYIKYAKDIMKPFIRECEKEYHLYCYGTGGQFAKNVAGIEISFIAYRKGTIEEARKLQVIMTEKLLTQVNAHEKIRPFLVEYPFKIKAIDISIAFRKPDDNRYTDGSVALVFLGRNNTLFYSAENPKTGKLVDVLKEPYEEALKIVFGRAPDEKELAGPTNSSPQNLPK